MAEINVYCDESNHLENDHRPMVLGLVSCPREKASQVNKRLSEIKSEHQLSPDFEIKWSKVSERRSQFYADLIDYFFDSNLLSFRGVICRKDALDNAAYGNSYDDWYYRMYFLLISKILDPENVYKICIDRKDTQGREKLKRLKRVLCNQEYDFEQKIIKEIREVHSHQAPMVQLADLLAGAIQFNLVSDPASENSAKRKIVEQIKRKSRYTLKRSTLPSEKKFNLFFWRGRQAMNID